MGKKIAIRDIAKKYEINEYETITCLERALSKIIGKEVFCNDKEDFSYFNEQTSSLIPLIITRKILISIPKAFEYEMTKIRNAKLKSLLYSGGEYCVLTCSITKYCIDYYEATSINDGFVGRLYINQTINPKETLKPNTVLDLKVKSLIKYKTAYQCVFTQLDYDIYKRNIYRVIEKDYIAKIKIDFQNKKIIITFHNNEDITDNYIKIAVSKLNVLISSFTILTKVNK